MSICSFLDRHGGDVCNPSHSGGGDRRIYAPKPVGARGEKKSEKPYL
jgi:hypothetical protein